MNKLLSVKRISVIFLIAMLSSVFCYAQERIVTAQDYLASISANYAKIEDYEADVAISREGEKMSGKMFYKSPSLLRINFDTPKDQVLVVDKEKLVIYVPKYPVIMEQKLKKSGTSGAGFASKDGLKLLKKNYSVAYLEGQDYVPLDKDSNEMVVKLKFVWNSTDECFREIEVSVGKDNLIRRMVGVTSDYKRMQFDFTNIRINTGISDARFKYDTPATATVLDNFLFGVE